MPRVAKNSGPTPLKSGFMFSPSFGSYPSTETVWLSSLLVMRATSAIDTERTPGSLPISSRICLKSACRRSSPYPLSAGSTAKASRRCGSKPGSSRRRFMRLRVKRPAPMRSRSDRAIWATTRPLRKWKGPGPPTTVPDSFLRVGATSGRVAWRAGTRPKTMPVSRDTASTRVAASMGRARNSSPAVHAETARPSAPPASARTRHSTRSCRTSRARLAPRARRRATSRCRDEARASIRLATFAHAMSNTRPTIPMSMTSGVFDWSRSPETPRPPGSRLSRLPRKAVRKRPDLGPRRSRSACSSRA